MASGLQNWQKAQYADSSDSGSDNKATSNKRPEKHAETCSGRNRAFPDSKKNREKSKPSIVNDTKGKGSRPLSENNQRPMRRPNNQPMKIKGVGLGYYELIEITSKSNSEIVVALLGKEEKLKFLLQLESIREDHLKLLLCALSKSLTLDMREFHPEITHKLVIFINNTIEHLKRHLERFISSGVFQDSLELKNKILESIPDVLIIGEALLSKFPSTAKPFLTILLLIIESFLKNAGLKGLRLTEEQKENFDSLKDHMQNQSSSNPENSAKRRQEVEHSQKPPEDFRTIPVIPVPEELLKEAKPFLRSNIVNGQYQDFDHYLDVQFRLMREDFATPLREGLCQYLENYTNEPRRGKKRNTHVRIYENVTVDHCELTRNGAVYYVQLDVSTLKHVNWIASKRLLPGSMICLSNDSFKTMSIGIVADRRPEVLKLGHVGILNEVNPEIVIAGNLNKSVFTIVESSAYFEASRHVLERLKLIADEKVILEKCLVKCETEQDHPPYLTDKTSFEFLPLMSTPCPVQVLDDDSWPSKESLSLDDSQLNSLRRCIQNQVALVQGPPGTGKTFLGLKVAKLLLFNKHIWQKANNGALLVVCYTNHALDQFLEGILNFNNNILRIGGRCKNEALQPYMLNQNSKSSRNYHAARYRLFDHQAEIKHDIEEMERDIDLSFKVVLSASKLRKAEIISEKQYFDLKKYQGDVAEWLGVYNVNNMNETKYISDQILNGEGDAEKIEFDVISDEDEEDERSMESWNFSQEQQFLQKNIESRNFQLAEFSKFCLQNVEEETSIMNDMNWQIQGRKRKLIRDLRRKLKDKNMMTAEEAERENTNAIRTYENRWRLYRYWLSCNLKKCEQQTAELHVQYLKVVNALKELREAEDLKVLQSAEVIGATTTGAAKYWRLLHQLNFPIMIVEEAAEVFEAHIITALGKDTEHLILIGDHQQLRPSPSVYDMVKKYHLDISLFERLIKNNMSCERLREQHRMRPEVSELITPTIYKNLKNHASVMNYPDVSGVGKNVFFIDHSYLEESEKENLSKSNVHEAEMILEIARYLHLQCYNAQNITILTTYSGQLFLLKNKIKSNLKFNCLNGVRVCVVDNYQGEENDIILISFVRSNVEGNIGFLKIDNRVCVALSRAKVGLFCIGNFTVMGEKNILWSQIIATLKQSSNFGTKLPLHCQKHPGTVTEVSIPSDFSAVPEGGCSLPCDFRLDCGHSCTRTCHVYDEKHKEYKCQKRCAKNSCEMGHNCPDRCHEGKECRPCQVKVKKVIPRCQHAQMVPCHMEENKVVCKEPCKRILMCGHPCKNPCGENCTRMCKHKVKVDSPCGHKVDVSCSESLMMTDDELLMRKCKVVCHQQLNCGHRCKGNCGTCYQGRIHIACKKDCDRTLVCGHVCKEFCSKNCPPCKKKCGNKCNHSKCEKLCGEPCVQCTDLCTWNCKHLKCTKRCSEPCNRPPCNYPCEKLLKKCRHPCIGMCGEPCPKKCLVCDKEEVTTIFFGNEDEPDARFVELRDCGHVVEVEGMDTWMQTTSSAEGQDSAIQLKGCPICKTTVRRTLRYKNSINSFLNDVEKVKAQSFGNKAKNVTKMTEVQRKVKEMLHENALIHYPEIQHLLQALNIICDSEDKSRESVDRADNCCLLVTSFYKIIKKCKSYSSTKNVNNKVEFLYQWMSKNMSMSNTQQLSEFSGELNKLKNLINLKEIYESVSFVKPEFKDLYVKTEKLLTERKVLGTDEKKFIENSLDRLSKTKTGLGISEEDRKMIVMAMSGEVKTGAFYKCKNGHLYAIGNCGGAMETSKCPDCGVVIGGQSHALAEGNFHAPEMDNSVRAAWPGN